MGFFDRLFGGHSYDENQPEVKIGRFSDAYKRKDRYEAWDRSLELFEEGKYREAFRDFFFYLSDHEHDNVQTEESEEELKFCLYQGSKQIDGFINGEKVRAEAKIARTKNLNIGFLRRMMEQNFMLKYGRYALDEEDNITILFDSYLLDGSPYKLYFALKEVAVNADKLDDLLLDEFDMLQEINNTHIDELPEVERKAKVEFMKSEIKYALDYIDSGKLNIEQYPGGIAYLLLDLMYKIDYLVAPEGPTVEAVERMHRTYFSNDRSSALQKVLALRKSLQELYDKDNAEIEKELYAVISTFGITTPSEHDKVKAFIESELQHMDWYMENKHEEIAESVSGFIVGYCLFNYAVPLPDKTFFHLYYQVMEHQYFKDLGFTLGFVEDSGKINGRSIKNAIDDIADKFKDKYPKLKPRTKGLNFKTKSEFAKSFLKMVHELDLTEKK